jgi:serine phosphatase RsbU (regulator of sigma subunit)
VTGLLGRVELRAGALEIVNAGHVAPFLVRAGRVSTLDLRPEPPLGMFADTTYTSSRIGLSPGDRVVFVTDGMLERNVAAVDLPTTLTDLQALHPREAVRAMADKALEAAGHELSDDATLLCLDWHGSHERDRSAVAGADPQRASDPLS